MVDVELDNATVAILLNRASIVLDELLELWDSPHDDNPDRLPPGYFDDSCSDDFDWYMGYRDSDMLIELTMHEAMWTLYRKLQELEQKEKDNG